MRFIIRPRDMEWIVDLLSSNQYKGIIILCIALVIAILGIAVSSRRKR